MKLQKTIYIGEIYCSQEPAIIHTIVGSCVAVCLFDHKIKIGGMNHIFLPGDANSKYQNNHTYYGVNAMEQLIKGIVKLGGDHRILKAKAYGGASFTGSKHNLNNTGESNISFVIDFLKTKNIPLLNFDLGGAFSRTIVCHTDTTDVFVNNFSTLGTKVLITN